MTSELSNTSLSSGNSGQTDGSCLCGAVKFSISGPPLMKLLCHCVSCKKISGSLFQANNFYSISTYVDKSPESGKGVHRTFCAVCGSRLWNTTPEHLDNVVVMVGSLNLNDEEWKKWTPEREFFCKRKGEWLGDGGAPEEGKTSEIYSKDMGQNQSKKAWDTWRCCRVDWNTNVLCKMTNSSSNERCQACGHWKCKECPQYLYKDVYCTDGKCGLNSLGC